MKKIVTLLVLLAVATLATNASAAIFYWTNTTLDQNFANTANWDAAPPFNGTDDLNINLSNEGDPNNAAVLSTTLSGGGPRRLHVGTNFDGGTGDGELHITGGTNVITDRFRVGTAYVGTVAISGGTTSVPNSFTTFGDGGPAVITMTGGTLNADRVTLGQAGLFFNTMDLSGGTVNISVTDSTPSATTSGTFRMGESAAAVSISGTAIMNAEALIMGDIDAGFGLISITGGELHLTGSTLTSPLPIIQFEDPNGADLGGTIAMEGGLWDLAGNQVSFINDAITAGYVTHSGIGTSLLPVYNSGTDVTTVTIIPEPASLGLAVLGGLGCLWTRRRKFNNGQPLQGAPPYFWRKNGS